MPFCGHHAFCAQPRAHASLRGSHRRLTDAQIARTVALVSGANGVLCTALAVDGSEGATFTCPAPFVTDANGCPIMALASTETASNLKSNTLATFHTRAPAGGAAASSAITLIGQVDEIAEADVEDEPKNAIDNCEKRKS